MNKFALDLSKFKKIKSDGKTSTLRHQDGHEFKIAHAALSPQLRKGVESIALAGGGAVSSMLSPEDAQAASDKKLSISDDERAGMDAIKAKEGAISSDYGPVKPESSFLDKVSDLGTSNDRRDLIARRQWQQGLAQDQQAIASAPYTPPSQMQDSRMPAQEADPYDMTGVANAQMGALGEQKAGQQQSAMAQGALGEAQARQEQAYQQSQQGAIERFNNANAALDAERAGLQKDIAAGHVDPKRYMESMSTGKHIMTGIGLILGGMGAGLTGGPNYAYNNLQANIDRDIASQKEDLGIKENLLSHNLSQTQNLRAATELTRMQMNDLLSSQLKMEAGKSMNQVAKGNALNIAGQIDMQSAQIKHNLAMQHALMGGAQGAPQDPEASFQKQMQYLRMNGQEAMAKDMEAKHLPGVGGRASVELSPDNRKEWMHLVNLNKSYNDAQDYLNKAGKLGAGFMNANKARGVAIGHSLELELGQLEGLGRFTPEEAKRYKEMIPDMGGTHFTNQDMAKLNQLQTEVHHHMNTFKEGVGLKGDEAQPQAATVNPQTYIQWAKQNPNNPKAQIILKKFGTR